MIEDRGAGTRRVAEKPGGEKHRRPKKHNGQKLVGQTTGVPIISTSECSKRRNNLTGKTGNSSNSGIPSPCMNQWRADRREGGTLRATLFAKRLGKAFPQVTAKKTMTCIKRMRGDKLRNFIFRDGRPLIRRETHIFHTLSLQTINMAVHESIPLPPANDERRFLDSQGKYQNFGIHDRIPCHHLKS